MEKKKNVKTVAEEKPSFLSGIVMCEDLDEADHFAGTSGALPGFSGGPAFTTNGRFLGICLTGPEITDHQTTFASFVTDFAHTLSEAQYARFLHCKEMMDRLHRVSFLFIYQKLITFKNFCKIKLKYLKAKLNFLF